jgi:hypothetical protein
MNKKIKKVFVPIYHVLEEYDRLDEYLDNFKVFGVFIKNLTPEQVFQLNDEFKHFVRKLRIASLVLFILFTLVAAKVYFAADYLYTLLIVVAPTFTTPFLVEHYNSFLILISIIFFMFSLLIPFKFYDAVGNYFIGNKIQYFELLNLKDKYESKKYDSKKIDEPYSPEVQKEVDEIRALGKAK